MVETLTRGIRFSDRVSTRGLVLVEFNRAPRNHSTRFQSYIYIYIGKVVDGSQGWPKGSLFNSYYSKVQGRALLLSLDCSTLPLIRTLYCWVLSKEESSTIFKVFGVTRPGIKPRSTGPLANNAKSVDGRNDSIFGFSFFNIHVIKNSKEASI